MTTTTAAFAWPTQPRRPALDQPFLNENGRITEDAEDVFRLEYCWYLAWVLHAQTGWPIVAVSEGTEPLDGGTGWNHVLVRHPGGKLLDITGLCEDNDVYDEWAVALEEDMEEGDEAILEEIPASTFRTRLNADPDAVPAALVEKTPALARALLQQIDQPVDNQQPSHQAPKAS